MNELDQLAGAPAPAPAAPIVPAELTAEAAADAPGRSTDRAKPEPAAAAPAPVAIDYQVDARELVDFTVDLLAEPYPSIAPIYTERVRSRLTDRIAAVLAKYGVTWAQLLGRYGPEIMLGLAIAPLVGPTWRAIRTDHQAANAPARPVDRPTDRPIDRSNPAPTDRPAGASIERPAARSIEGARLADRFPGIDAPASAPAGA